MAGFESAKNSVFQIANVSAALQDISPYVVSVTGLPGTRDLGPATVIGDAGDKHFPTIQKVTIRLELLWSKDVTVGADTVLGPLLTHTAATAFDYGPEGKAGGDIKYSGNCWVRSYEITSRAGNLVTATAELAVEGIVTKGTYAA